MTIDIKRADELAVKFGGVFPAWVAEHADDLDGAVGIELLSTDMGDVDDPAWLWRVTYQRRASGLGVDLGWEHRTRDIITRPLPVVVVKGDPAVSFEVAEASTRPDRSLQLERTGEAPDPGTQPPSVVVS